MIRMATARYFSLFALATALGCSSNSTTSSCPAGMVCTAADAGGDAAPGGDTMATDTANSDTASADTAASMCNPVEPLCTDDQILDLSLFKPASDRTIDNAADGNGFLSTIDSSGGGFSPTEAYVYAKFTDKGLIPVAIGDEKAFVSQDWDIAARRFIVRLNGGVSGPSCVTAYKFSSANKFDEVTAIPDGATFKPEAYYDASCKVVADKSGLGTPATQLATFWKYSNCVQMTGAVFALQLANGRHVKLSVSSYYQPDAQTACNAKGSVPQGSEGGNLGVRWAFLD